jgi:hypothetical protein
MHTESYLIRCLINIQINLFIYSLTLVVFFRFLQGKLYSMKNRSLINVFFSELTFFPLITRKAKLTIIVTSATV